MLAKPLYAVCAPCEIPTPALIGATEGVASKLAVNVPVSVTPIGVSCHAPSAEASAQAELMVKLTVAECARLPFVPVIVKVNVPVAAVLDAAQVNVEEPEAVIAVGLKLQVTPAGDPSALRFTVPVKPFSGVTLAV